MALEATQKQTHRKKRN